jgi:hypothetical protein
MVAESLYTPTTVRFVHAFLTDSTVPLELKAAHTTSTHNACLHAYYDSGGGADRVYIMRSDDKVATLELITLARQSANMLLAVQSPKHTWMLLSVCACMTEKGLPYFNWHCLAGIADMRHDEHSCFACFMYHACRCAPPACKGVPAVLLQWGSRGKAMRVYLVATFPSYGDDYSVDDRCAHAFTVVCRALYTPSITTTTNFSSNLKHLLFDTTTAEKHPHQQGCCTRAR